MIAFFRLYRVTSFCNSTYQAEDCNLLNVSTQICLHSSTLDHNITTEMRSTLFLYYIKKVMRFKI